MKDKGRFIVGRAASSPRRSLRAYSYRHNSSCSSDQRRNFQRCRDGISHKNRSEMTDIHQATCNQIKARLTEVDSRFVARSPAVYPYAVVVAVARAVFFPAFPITTSAMEGLKGKSCSFLQTFYTTCDALPYWTSQPQLKNLIGQPRSHLQGETGQRCSTRHKRHMRNGGIGS